MPGALLNVAWAASMRATFGLPLDAVGMLLIAMTSGYCVGSSASGRWIDRAGAAPLLAFSTALSALGLLGVAIAPTWAAVLLFGLLVGMGGGVLDGGMNIYFAANYGPRLMNWLHACFGIGSTVAALAMTGILRSGHSWRLAYGLAALLYGVVVGLFVSTRVRWSVRADEVSGRPLVAAAAWQTLRLPVVWLGIGLFLVCTGLEMSAGQWSFSLFTEARHVRRDLAGLWVSLYWGSFTVGRVFFGTILTWVRPVALLRRCMGGVALGAALLGWKSGPGAGCLALALLGFSLSPVFALMITSTQERLGPVHAPNAIGLQVAAAGLGAGLLPATAGVLARNLGLEIVPSFLLALSVTMIALFEASRRARVGAPVPPS
jgi:fucose permease